MPKSPRQTYTVYFASELFSLKHLIGNAYLAEAIYEKSHGRFRCILPQDIELRVSHPRAIRDKDILTLLECDLALFNFDGPELDAGTVVEFMFAKFADIPSVILRSDIRSAGDQPGRDPWNLMTSFYPRTRSVVAPSLHLYKTVQKRRPAPRAARTDDALRLAGQHSSAHAQTMCDQIAATVVAAFDNVLLQEPAMPKHVREEVFTWLARMPGLRGKEKDLRKQLEKILEQKVQRDLL